MQPSSNESQPQFELPIPSEGLEKTREKAPERGAVSEKSGEQSRPSGPPAPVTPDPASLNAAAQAAIPVTPVPSPSAPTASGGLVAHDVDLIEKEWVERAKSIVAQTYEDPHAQKKEMSKVKAEYIQKRFNKTVETDET